MAKIRIFVLQASRFMAKITAYLSARVDARGKSEILLRFVGGRDHIYRLHSHLSVTPSRWKDGSVIIPRLETDEQRELKGLRSRLDGLTAHLLDTFEALHSEDRTKERMQEAVGVPVLNVMREEESHDPADI